MPQCYTIRGGFYQPSKSTTNTGSIDGPAAGGDPTDVSCAHRESHLYCDWTEDTLTLGNATLDSFLVGMPGFGAGEDFVTQPNIGLGRNSTILNALRAAGQIKSRTYSYWWGVNNAVSSRSVDGQLVFGGYDAAKIMGPNITRKLREPTVSCPSGMYLTITNMILDFPNGTTADMLAPTALSACVRLDWPTVVSIPHEPFVARFESLTNTSHATAATEGVWEMPSYSLIGE